MPLVGLTKDASSGPSPVVMAFLNELINAVTWGSWQKFAAGAGAVAVTPGTAVESPVTGVFSGVTPVGGMTVGGITVGGMTVNADAVSVMITGNVSVTKIRGVGVTTAGVAEPHAVRTTANRTTPVRCGISIFVFMGLFSYLVIIY